MAFAANQPTTEGQPNSDGMTTLFQHGDLNERMSKAGSADLRNSKVVSAASKPAMKGQPNPDEMATMSSCWGQQRVLVSLGATHEFPFPWPGRRY